MSVHKLEIDLLTGEKKLELFTPEIFSTINDTKVKFTIPKYPYFNLEPKMYMYIKCPKQNYDSTETSSNNTLDCILNPDDNAIKI